jgi:hypothetical protein
MLGDNTVASSDRDCRPEVDQPEIRAQTAITKPKFMTPNDEMVVVSSLAVNQVRPIAGPEVAHVRSIWRAFHCAMSEPK